jgi:hypothetical protein
VRGPQELPAVRGARRGPADRILDRAGTYLRTPVAVYRRMVPTVFLPRWRAVEPADPPQATVPAFVADALADTTQLAVLIP